MKQTSHIKKYRNIYMLLLAIAILSAVLVYLIDKDASKTNMILSNMLIFFVSPISSISSGIYYRKYSRLMIEQKRKNS